MPPKVSVVIPVYNRAHSVLPTLRSVQDQTFADFECIVVDDGSSDGAELRALVEGLQDHRFRYVQRENGGASAARNTGIDEAQGDIVAFLDSDDRWLPAKLQHDIEAIGPNSVVYSAMLVQRRGVIRARRPSRGARDGEAISEYVTRGQGFVPNSTIAVSTALARQVRYDEALCLGDDTDFAIRLAASGADFRFVEGAAAIMNDDEDSARLSRSVDWRSSSQWLDRIAPLLSTQSRLAFRGWHIARMAAQAGDYKFAAKFYFEALLRGAFTPSLATKAALQLVVPRRAYNWIRR